MHADTGVFIYTSYIFATLISQVNMSRYIFFFLSALLTLTYVESFGCEKHEHCSICGHYKESQCYDFVKAPNFIQCISGLRPGCRCDKDFVRNPHSKKCVKKSDCFVSSLRGWRDNIIDSITDKII
ncbi:uncharacterized protein LOC123269970 [Cotesia glomerata]|uniref:uncharacterized protein LOC123269970 n=1 Tax=Cotesia glomerata TaxID=32391 RepID=UPI001D02A0AC|nr:uncharacterized protein LOC123269970 [Cotesia glomerata]